MGSRILLADDSITIQKVVNLTFADEGIEVVAVSNGDQAERRLSEIKPDLVLADIFMPGKNGYELCEAIKESPQFRNVPVVLLVGAFEPFDQAEARRVRADAHLTKPFESRTLVETVRRLISASPQPAVASLTPPAMPDGERSQGVRATGPIVSTPMAPPPAGFDASLMSADLEVVSQSPVRATGDLASPGPFVAPLMTTEAALGLTSHETATATLPDPFERFEPIELSSVPDSMPDFESQANVLDFDKLEASEAPAPPLSFEAGQSLPREVHSPVVADEIERFGEPAPPTTRLEAPPAESSWEPGVTTPLPFQDVSSFAFENAADPGAAEASDGGAVNTLLGVDEPLGDVLDSDGASAEPAQFADVLAGDSLGFEFSEQPDAAAPNSSSQVDLFDTNTAESAQGSVSVEAEPAAPEAAAVDAPADSANKGNVAEVEAPALEEPAVQHAADSDWTSPRASVYSTAQLDPVVIPVRGTESSEEFTPPLGSETEAEEVSSVELAPTSGEEEATFSAIDAETEETQTPRDGVAAVETGFSLMPVTESDPAPAPQPETQVPVTPAAEAKPAADLSNATIEELVRRVVVQMSESVVREVAWEVIPDCVERVVERLARESLSKRM